jgi:glycosyltransferase involved in cell wall biosynthesis
MEYIVIDGGSVDETLHVIKKRESKIAKWISEPDRGIYDAMNKGISLASGDIVGILNSDDFFANNSAIERVVSFIERH